MDANWVRDFGTTDRLNTPMDVSVEPAPSLTDPPVLVARPATQTTPLVFASPHSGRCYSDEFLAASRLDPLRLRRSEDSFVDELFSSAVGFGAPLVHATFPRAWCDPNREPWELDPAMFAETFDRFARVRIYSVEIVHHTSQQPAVLSIGPVRQPAIGPASGDSRIESPQPPSRGAIERDEL